MNRTAMMYWPARNFIHGMSRLLWRVSVRGVENVPRSGPLIVACNHRSFLDPPVMGSFVPRQIYFMAKKELFDIPLLGPAIASVGAYPVDREGSATAAIKRSVEVLRRGDCIGIFPEGGRNTDGEKEARQGVALLASLAKAPVLPAAIVGGDRAKRLGKIKVAYGKPLTLPADRKATRDDLAKFTEEVMSAIFALVESLG
ncbi:MAG: 1-acyl-sn-glycerol-3-phosphate acyltransferase [Candidatus Eremiobacteraeota bacterium]|nr:1-acyl-sn-glycerol-3-phosphate acyltransferase [Candidatus Eremiobacteraeota bacterium]